MADDNRSDVLKKITCAVAFDEHIAEDGCTLSCGHFICENCIPDDYKVTCIKCAIVNENDLRNAPRSVFAKNLVADNLAMLNQFCIYNITKERERIISSEKIMKNI
jgi:hypothetical protein